MLTGTLTDSNTILGKPCILLQGDTGSGKTNCLGSMARHGKRGIIADLERRTKHIQRHKMLVVDCPTRKHVSEFVMLISEPVERKKFVKINTKGEWDDVDFAGFDSLLEYEWRLTADLDVEFATNANKFAKWDAYAQRYVNLMRAMRDVASSPVDPIGVIMIMGERGSIDSYGNTVYKPLIKGNVAPDRAPFIPDFAFHLESSVEAGVAHWYVHTVGGAGFTSKGPGTSVLKPKVDITDGLTSGFKVEIWDKLEAFLKGEQ